MQLLTQVVPLPDLLSPARCVSERAISTSVLNIVLCHIKSDLNLRVTSACDLQAWVLVIFLLNASVRNAVVKRIATRSTQCCYNYRRRWSWSGLCANGEIGLYVGLKSSKDAGVMLPIVPVKVRSSGSNKFVTTYAFLDPGSTASFCTEWRSIWMQSAPNDDRFECNRSGCDTTTNAEMQCSYKI